MIKNELEAHRETIDRVIELLMNEIEKACTITVDTLKNGGRVFLCGNGGSAADAQHIAAELSGRFVKERQGLPGLALTTDTSVLTAVANDYSFDQVFARQVEALGRAGDLLIGISTSGNSQNVINAFTKARQTDMRTIGLSGRNGGRLGDFCDLNLIVPADSTARIQEVHILVGHIICQAVDHSI